MTAKTDYFENKLIDAVRRGLPFVVGADQLQWVATAGAPANASPTTYWGLLNLTAWSPGLVLSGATFIVRPDSAGVLHLLKATTGTASTTAPTAPTANGGTVTDGTITWTDQYSVLEAGTIASLPAEFTGGGYARVGLALTTANWNNTQAAGGATASSGTNGTTGNIGTMTFSNMPAGNAGLFIEYDASTAGNILTYGFVTSGPVAIGAGATVTFAAGALTVQEDN